MPQPDSRDGKAENHDSAEVEPHRIKRLRDKVNRHQLEITRLRQQLEAALSSVEQARADAYQLERRLSRARCRISDLEGQVLELTDQVLMLQAKLRHAKENPRIVTGATKHIVAQQYE